MGLEQSGEEDLTGTPRCGHLQYFLSENFISSQNLGSHLKATNTSAGGDTSPKQLKGAPDGHLSPHATQCHWVLSGPQPGHWYLTAS